MSATTEESPLLASKSAPALASKDDSLALEQQELRRKVIWAFPALAIGIFLSATDQTIIVSSYAKIGSEFNALDKTSWIATAYLLTLTSSQPLYGKLSDIFGRKAALLCSYGTFSLGCLWCGLARGMNELIAARALAGIGGGGMTAVVAIFLSDVIPLRERGTWQGYANIVFATGAGVGAPLGGFLTDSIGWRWAFLLQVPLGIAAFTIILFVLSLPDDDAEGWKRKLKRVDFLGAAILIAGVSALTLGLDRGVARGWSDPVTISLLSSSPVLLAAFLFTEINLAKEPLAPTNVLFDRTSAACLISSFFSFGALLGINYFLPLYWQAVEKLSATQAGVRLLPGVIGIVCGSLFAGLLIQKTGRYYWLTVGCYVGAIVGLIPIALFTGFYTHAISGIWFGHIITGFSVGAGGTSSLIALISNATPKDHAVSIGCFYLFRSLGSTVGISVAAAVVQQVLKIRLALALPDSIDADKVARGVTESLDYVKDLPEEVREVVAGCYEVAIRWSWVWDAVLAVGALLAVVAITEKRIGR